MAFAALALAAVSSYGNYKSEKEARKANRIQRKREMLASRRNVIQSVRQATIEDATLAAQGALQNIQGSSMLSGAQGSVRSQESSNIAFFNETSRLKNQAAAKLEEASKLGAITNIGTSLFSAWMGTDFSGGGSTSPSSGSAVNTNGFLNSYV